MHSTVVWLAAGGGQPSVLQEKDGKEGEEKRKGFPISAHPRPKLCLCRRQAPQLVDRASGPGRPRWATKKKGRERKKKGLLTPTIAMMPY